LHKFPTENSWKVEIAHTVFVKLEEKEELIEQKKSNHLKIPRQPELGR